MKYAFGDMPNSLKWFFAFKLFVAAIGEFSDRRAFNVPRKVHRKRLHQPWKEIFLPTAFFSI